MAKKTDGPKAALEDPEGLWNPWDGEAPDFKPLPSVNPRTGKAVELSVCTSCGALVAARKIHLRWHRKQGF